MRNTITSVTVALLFSTTQYLHGARPVARWDVVPDQRIEGLFKAGVCAFHTGGVKVEFRVADTLVHTAAKPTRNDRTGVWEFWCPLDPADYADGPVSLAARAVPLNDRDPSYDLPELTLYANSGGTLSVATTNWVDSVNGNDGGDGSEASPYATLKKAVKNTPAGGTIFLKAGNYASGRLGGGSSRAYWTTIQAAPGVARDDVEVGPGRPGTQRLKWRNLTLYCDTDSGKYATILAGENGSHSVWLDNCKSFNKKGRWAAGATVFGNRYVPYITGGLTTEMAGGPGGRLIRGHTIKDITSDAWTGGSRLVVNSACYGIDRGPTQAHPDFHQSYAVAPNWVEDVILYNVRGYDCISQGLFGSRLRNAAFVNVLFEKGETVMYSQYSGPMENVLFLHLNIVHQSWLWRDGYAPVGVQVINGIFQNMSSTTGSHPAGLTVDHNHFVRATATMGTNKTTGDPLYLSKEDNDFRIPQRSPAAGLGRALQCVPTDIDGTPYDTRGRNRGCYAKPPDGAVVNATNLEVRRVGDLNTTQEDGCTIERFAVLSPCMGKNIRVAVVLPPAYSADNGDAFPVLYALHGYGAPYDTWSHMSPLRKALREQPMIVVCFDGDKGSAYIDAPKVARSQFTTFFFDELVPYVESTYRADPARRGVTGFSMGGFGALHYALTRPDAFVAVSSLSGWFPHLGDKNEKSGTFIADLLGPFDESAAAYAALDPFKRIASQNGAALPPLYLHCGTSDDLVSQNRELRDVLTGQKMPCEYVESEGGHNWPFWKSASAGVAAFHWKHFQAAMRD